MDNPTIIIKRTKMELRTYNLFSSIHRSTLRRLLQYIIPILGLVQIGIYFFMVKSPLNLAIGAFLIFYPFIVRYQIIRASDRSFDANKLQDYEIKVEFSEDNFTTENNIVCQKLMYSDVYKIYNRSNDIIIYLSKHSGLYLTKASYNPDVMNRIITLLQTAIPEKF